MKQLSIFDQRRAKQDRDAAIEQVSRSRWLALAIQAVREVAEFGRPFTTDDVLKHSSELEKCEELRVLGAAVQHCKREGLIRPLGYGDSSRVKSHGRPKRIWIKNNVK